ncbi:hypothetical protein DIPPA_65899 [Diplonema papillatum]|nr:hypothetical protein DIPPA_65896 [Diplonema papillatum]KAJ9446646.1 hypothetical protein DIPPA_65898 [Diplonema papillatum]KAJ9446647.1 hypothetical protein DIPPA_65899 [Diplonema papillatum]
MSSKIEGAIGASAAGKLERERHGVRSSDVDKLTFVRGQPREGAIWGAASDRGHDRGSARLQFFSVPTLTKTLHVDWWMNAFVATWTVSVAGDCGCIYGSMAGRCLWGTAT